MVGVAIEWQTKQDQTIKTQSNRVNLSVLEGPCETARNCNGKGPPGRGKNRPKGREKFDVFDNSKDIFLIFVPGSSCLSLASAQGAESHFKKLV